MTFAVVCTCVVLAALVLANDAGESARETYRRLIDMFTPEPEECPCLWCELEREWEADRG